jgi:hypothetical protein
MSFPLLAWEGTDNDTLSHIEIDENYLITEGRNIKVYNHTTNQHRFIKVQLIIARESGTEIEGEDIETGEHYVLIMD